MRPPHATTRTTDSGARSARLKPVGALAVVCVMSASVPVMAAPARLGVVTQLAVNLDAEAAAQVVDTIAELTEQRRNLDVVYGETAARRLPPDGVPSDCLARPACLQDLGSRLSAEQLLLLVLVKLGENVQMDATWVDVSTMRTAPRPAITWRAGDSDSRRAALEGALDTLIPRSVEAPAQGERLDTQTATRAPALELGTAGEADAGGPSLAWPTLVLGGISVAALATGAGLGISSLAQGARLNDDGCRTTPCDADRVDRLSRTALAADVLLGVGVAAGLAAGLTWYLQGQQDTTTLSFAPTAGGAWVGVRGSL